ncbi:glycosyltransferase involved in cell wall biosynthesis [Halomonas campaniensis]|uniref:Glycosyltransferase involved in cell wall biosynthesis n=1 Tax=Halomonas campaniensis TaxID=213554 RepID=A0A7W5PCF8_9GAMM|nr:glycosyltransferase family 2 protein [Halomonas campaniensis]MBB3332572.1 glycosyltransferase involved in cell wall biosynthesis [Halomonas campaniensis]
MADCSISIIIPAYNVEKYLKAALDSIKAQTELPDEVILIDDGSTDKTLAVAEEYDFSIPYKVLSIENGGQGNARNIGAELANFQYLYFFDADDLLDKNFISSFQSCIIRENFPDILLFSSMSFYDNEYSGSRRQEYCRGFSGLFLDRDDFLDSGYGKKGLFCSPCMYVSKATLWKGAALKFGDGYFEDEAVFFPLLFSCNSFLVVDEFFFYRRIRDGSTMTMLPSSRHVSGALNCMNTLRELYSSKRLSKREVWHIRKRMKQHCARYLRVSRDSRTPIAWDKVVDSVVLSRSFSLVARCLIYIMHAERLLFFLKKISDKLAR